MPLCSESIFDHLLPEMKHWGILKIYGYLYMLV